MQQPEQPTFRQLPMYDKLIYKPSEPFSLLSSRALTIGDVDNDRDLELVLGTTTGDLFIIKHDQPWRSYSGLQTISAIAIGDVYNQGKNSLIVTTCECACYVFDVSVTPALHPAPASNPPTLANALSSSSFSSSSFARRETLPKPTPSASLTASSSSVSSSVLDAPAVEAIAPNVQVVVLFDYDADGKVELLVGRSDRAVDCYVMALRDTPPQPLARPPSAASATSPSMQGEANGLTSLASRYQLKRRATWSVAGEVASLVPVLDATGKRLVLVGQQSGSFAVLSQDGTVNTPVAALTAAGPPSLLLPYGLDANGRPLLLVSTLNSPLKCYRDDGKAMWDTQLDPHLCALGRLTLPGAGGSTSVVAACSYDGMTYLLTKPNQAVQLPFPERVCAFTAGDLTVFPGQTLPCLVYVTSDGRVFVYYTIRHLTEALSESDVIEDLAAEFEALRAALKIEKPWTREEKVQMLSVVWDNADRIPRG